MRFNVQTDNTKIRAAVKEVENFIEALGRGEIGLPDYFTHTSQTASQVSSNIVVAVFGYDPIPVREYTSSWFFRNVLGNFSKGAININTRFSSTASVADIAGNIMHEYCHALGYEHKGNKVTPYNLKSVPYVLGYACRDWVKEK
jgi:hypothetical protein